ncbi:hypothetical protein H310_10791 [Aphanomyces invadans]|uniref:Uncharacterized protein n=1 Tax=Aphanomyces invadans TaxID=157072 RepID=A0A024TNY4_9STRA|nr:hypothetical protein H310_10791 [Aphanomyces invadans]ETV95719.1 hypothetical protein H310_10791 [Aphanomyces invadans]|eukprot:XP_008875470.1 hypothetical protein H310_10791 [Aphanomyces invadans]
MKLKITRTTTVVDSSPYSVYVPETTRTGAARTGGSSPRTDSTKVHRGDVWRFSQTVDQVLDEAIAANEAAAATIKNQAAQTADALKTKRFDLAELTTLGCIDAAWRNVCLHPIVAGAQLKEMARLNRTLFFHFISQHTLNRLFRATYGQSRPFDVLYKLVVGENYSTTSMTTYFRKVQAAKMLPSWTIRNKNDELDDGDVLQSLDAEEILALAEVLLAINAPLVHSNDAIIATIARAPVTTIAMKEGARALSSATLLSFYKNCDEPHDTFCQDLWCQMKELAEPGTDDDEAVFSTNIELFDALITDKEWPIVGTMQVMATPHSTDGQLEVGDLDEGLADTVDDAPPRN